MARKKNIYTISRNEKRLIVFLLVITAIGISLTDRFFAGSIRYRVSHFGSDYDDYRKYHGKSFTVINVVDGDTIDIDIPDGNAEFTRVRLLGIDTPEKGGSGRDAMFFAEDASLFTSQKVLNKNVTILIDEVGDVRGKYGRLLGYIKMEDNTILNEQIICEGYGYADTRFIHSRLNDYMNLQKEAVKNNKGLWKQAEDDDLPKWLLRSGNK